MNIYKYRDIYFEYNNEVNTYLTLSLNTFNIYSIYERLPLSFKDNFI